MEIGINNYDPSQFMNQEFTIYFFKENHSDSSTAPQTINDTRDDDDEEHKIMPKSVTKSIGLMAEMPRGEYEMLMDRIRDNLVAF